MCEFKIGTLNLNGARDKVKRDAFFKLMDLKKLDIILVQETHSTVDNESDWRKGVCVVRSPAVVEVWGLCSLKNFF